MSSTTSIMNKKGKSKSAREENTLCLPQLRMSSHSSPVQICGGSTKGKLHGHQKLAKELSEDTHLLAREVEMLLWIYERIVQQYNVNTMTESIFTEVMFNTFGYTNHLIVSKIFNSIKKTVRIGSVRNIKETSRLECKTSMTARSACKRPIIPLQQEQSLPGITESRWICLINIFLRGTLKEKSKFVFNVLSQKEEYISKATIEELISNTGLVGIDNDSDIEIANSMTALYFNQMNKTKNQHIFEKDFLTRIQEEPILLDVIGPILPNWEEVQAFEAVLGNENMENMRSYYSSMLSTKKLYDENDSHLFNTDCYITNKQNLSNRIINTVTDLIFYTSHLSNPNDV